MQLTNFNTFDHLIRDSSYLQKQKFLLCYYSENKVERTEFPEQHNKIPKSLLKKNTMVPPTYTSKAIPDLTNNVSLTSLGTMETGAGAGNGDQTKRHKRQSSKYILI